MIPDWMKDAGIGPCSCSAVHHGRKSFIGKTIEGIFDFLQDAFVTENYARRPGLLQSLDPNTKLISMLVLIFATSLTQSLIVLIAVYLLTVILAFLSRIEIGFFIKRVWLFIPLFAGIIALPMIFRGF